MGNCSKRKYRNCNGMIKKNDTICDICNRSYKQGVADTIDEFVDSLTCQACFTNMQKDAIRIYAEQLKEQNQ